MNRRTERRVLTGLTLIEYVWIRLIPALALGMAFWAILIASNKISAVELKAEAVAIRDQQQLQGRKLAVDALCGGLKGVQQAGAAAITGALFDRPDPSPEQVRAARRYASIISQGVFAQAGVDARGLVHEDGTMDCDKLREVARADP